jgi:hypothetical protein
MRHRSTYRGARRNEVLRGDVKGVWRGIAATYRPRQVKPPVVKVGVFGAFSRMRPQPKVYRANGERECARRRAQAA